MNKAILVGNLTKDPKLHVTTNGYSCCMFTLAVNRRYASQQTGKREADFINVVTWNALAESCAERLAKGSKAVVSGSIQSRSYDTQDGGKRYVTEVVADEVVFVSTPSGSGSGTDTRYRHAPERGEQMRMNYYPQPEGDIDVIELPF